MLWESKNKGKTGSIINQIEDLAIDKHIELVRYLKYIINIVNLCVAETLIPLISASNGFWWALIDWYKIVRRYSIIWMPSLNSHYGRILQ